MRNATNDEVQESLEFVKDFLRLLENTRLFGPLMDTAMKHMETIEQSAPSKELTEQRRSG